MFWYVGRISRGSRRQSSSQVAILGEFQSRFSESREIVDPLCRVSRENEASMFAATLTRCTYTTWMYDDRFSTRSDRDFIFLAWMRRRIHMAVKDTSEALLPLNIDVFQPVLNQAHLWSRHKIILVTRDWRQRAVIPVKLARGGCSLVPGHAALLNVDCVSFPRESFTARVANVVERAVRHAAIMIVLAVAPYAPVRLQLVNRKYVIVQFLLTGVRFGAFAHGTRIRHPLLVRVRTMFRHRVPE